MSGRCFLGVVEDQPFAQTGFAQHVFVRVEHFEQRPHQHDARQNRIGAAGSRPGIFCRSAGVIANRRCSSAKMSEKRTTLLCSALSLLLDGASLRGTSGVQISASARPVPDEIATKSKPMR